MHTADQQYGPCSCQDDGRCLYVNGGPACMNEQQGAPTPRVDALLLVVDEGRVYKDYGPTVDLARQLERELSAAQQQIAALREQYDDLIMQVASKYPGETRHQTAKRYIAQSEIPMPNAALAASRKSNG